MHIYLCAGLVVPAWLMRALMSSFHFLAAAGVQLGGSLMHSELFV